MLCKSLVWFRFLRRKIYPWPTLAIACCRLMWMCSDERRKEKVRLMLALTKIDFVNVYSFLNDLLW